MLALLAATLTLAVPAETPSFAALRSEAEVVKNVGRFLERALGDCASDDPEFDRAGCEARAAEERKGLKGKTFRMEVDDVESVLSFAGWDKGRQAFRLHFTPIFGERGLAMSVGRPAKLNADGLPVVKNIPVWVNPPKGEPQAIFQHQLERGQVRLEVVFRLAGAWQMTRSKKDTPVRGLEVELLGLRVYSRAGQLLAEETTR